MNKIEKAIERIKFASDIAKSHGNTLICAYSGGKDSDVLLDLCVKSDVEFEAQHNHTTVDAPETVYHIREVFKKLRGGGYSCKINYPEITMWDLIAIKRMPPTQIVRYCCEYLKERRFESQHIMTGVRWAESNKRKSRGIHEKLHKVKDKRVIYLDESDDARKLTEICIMKCRVATNPIIDWTDYDVWKYVEENSIIMNPLYKKGYHRVGCIGCPMAGKERYRHFNDYPKYKNNYTKAFQRMIDKRKQDGLPILEHHANGENVMKWWLKEDINQMSMWEDES